MHNRKTVTGATPITALFLNPLLVYLCELILAILNLASSRCIITELECQYIWVQVETGSICKYIFIDCAYLSNKTAFNRTECRSFRRFLRNLGSALFGRVSNDR